VVQEGERMGDGANVRATRVSTVLTLTMLHPSAAPLWMERERIARCHHPMFASLPR